MAVPTYDELLAHYNVEKSIMKQTFDDEHLREFSLVLDTLETLAKFLGIPNSDITAIKNQGCAIEQRMKMLECWKQRCGSMATYEAMVKALLKINRTDLAEKIITLQQSSNAINSLETATTNQSLPYPRESSLEKPTFPAGSSGRDEVSLQAAMSSLSLPATPNEYPAQDVIPTLRELEEEFYGLVIFIEDTLENSEISLNTITRRFRMLPQSVRRQHETDENYTATRQKILDSKTTKKLFDNLTELKHWSYMTPDTLAHILKDVKIDGVHSKVKKYKDKLMAFKANTKLKELVGISYPVPDYCMELTMEVEGWEDKTIQEVEDRAVNIVRRAAYSGSPHVRLGWKGVFPGSINVIFILLESVKLVPEKFCEESGVVSIHIDGNSVCSKDHTKTASTPCSTDYKQQSAVSIHESEIPRRLWNSEGGTVYSVGGGRDVLILAPDLSLPHHEAVARRPGKLTMGDKLKLLSQGVISEFDNELDIIMARYRRAKDCSIVEIKSGQSISYKEVLGSIRHVFNTTENDGVVLYYIGAGRRGTGDWCFEDGFITFKDIAQLYLRASHNFKGHVLTIISDCSYSGCWVRDCMEFLDEQGVQPCGHKAREKGIIIKVFTSCKSKEIPTEYHYPVDGMYNIGRTGGMSSWIAKQLLKTQTTDHIDSSELKCNNRSIDKPCTLPPGFIWRRSQETKKKSSVFVKQCEPESVSKGVPQH